MSWVAPFYTTHLILGTPPEGGFFDLHSRSWKAQIGVICL